MCLLCQTLQSYILIQRVSLMGACECFFDVTMRWLCGDTNNFLLQIKNSVFEIWVVSFFICTFAA